MIKNKEISSAELTKSVFDRIKAVEGKVDAYLTLDEENAMKKAAEIDEKLARARSFHLWLVYLLVSRTISQQRV